MLNLSLIWIIMLGTSTKEDLTLSGLSCFFVHLTTRFLSHYNSATILNEIFRALGLPEE